MCMSRLEAQSLVKRIVADADFLLRLARIEDDEELDLAIRSEGFESTWQEALDLSRSGPATHEESEEYPQAS
jgi:hypothetical protein